MKYGYISELIKHHSIKDVALKIGVSASKLYRINSGAYNIGSEPLTESIFLLCQYYNWDMSVVMHGYAKYLNDLAQEAKKN